jgi:hypothetical protein
MRDEHLGRALTARQMRRGACEYGGTGHPEKRTSISIHLSLLSRENCADLRMEVEVQNNNKRRR